MVRIAMLLVILTSACSTVPLAPPERAETLFHDEAFADTAPPLPREVIFALSPAMRQFLADHPALRSRERVSPQALADALYNPAELGLRYDSSLTRTAAQAFESRAGNCLSLVIMTAAFAKALHLPVEYQSVDGGPIWSRHGELEVASGHVNVTLTQVSRVPGQQAYGSGLTIDVLPLEDSATLRTSPISEDRVVAMFMNNRAAEALLAEHVDEAYGWARGALGADPAFGAAWNTLAVIYLRRGLDLAAEQVLQAALVRHPDDTRILGNLAGLLATRGARDEAEQLQARLARLDPEPPFLFFDRGVAAYQRDDLESARRLFARQLARTDYDPDVHFWLARTEYRLGRYREAREQLILAERASTTPEDRGLYAAKRARLAAEHPALP